METNEHSMDNNNCNGKLVRKLFYVNSKLKTSSKAKLWHSIKIIWNVLGS